MFEKKFDREEMDLDVEALRSILPEADLRRMGIIPREARPDPIVEGVVRSIGMIGAMNPSLDTPRGKDTGAVLPNYPSKYSDAEILFHFQSRGHAELLYNWITENGLLAPGEVSLVIEGIEYAVHVMPHVWFTKPEVFQAIMIAYNDFLYDSPDVAAAFEDFCEDLGAVVEAKSKSKGKGAEFGIHGNPFHGADSGKFVARKDLSAAGRGSRSKVRIKKKVKGRGESLSFVFTKNPCGRDARLAGKATRCWDGKEPAWWRGEQLARSLQAALESRPLPEGAQAALDDFLAR